MADKKISQLPAATLPLAGTELLPIVQSGTTDNITINNLAVGNIKSNATTGVLQVSGPAAGTTRVMTTPNANFTAARTDAGQTFSGSQTITGNVTAQGYGNVYYKIQSLDSANYRMAIKMSADDESLVITSGSDYKVLTTTGYSTPDTTRIYAGNAEQLRVLSSGNVTAVTGNFVVGTSGKGIDFSATPQPAGMTSELLSDYEEGTWTPAITTTGGSVSVGQNTGIYVKVGKAVHYSAFINVASVSSPTGNVKITGLPYTSGTGLTADEVPSAVFCYGLIAGTSSQVMATVDPNATTASVYGFAVSTGTYVSLATAFQAGTSIRISGTYFV